jgi:hypothetical protein
MTLPPQPPPRPPLLPSHTDDPDSSRNSTPTVLGKRKARPPSSTAASTGPTVDRLETRLGHLKTDCLLIDVVLKSLQTFFPAQPMTTKEQLDKVDKELTIAYDDLLAQIRVLYRNVNKLDQAIRSLQSSLPSPMPSSLPP